MKKRVLRSLLAIALLITITNNNYVSANAKVISNEATINLDDYTISTRERFVASLALENNISYEEADILERQEASTILRAPDEVLCYATISKNAGNIYGISGYVQPVFISTEVRCVWNRATNSLTNIENIGNPITTLPGDRNSNVSMIGGDYNIEQYSKSGRISQTVAFEYYVEGINISIGGDVLGVSKQFAGVIVTTAAKTYAIQITEQDIRQAPKTYM